MNSDHRVLIHKEAHEQSLWMAELAQAHEWQDQLTQAVDDEDTKQADHIRDLIDIYGTDTHWSEHVLEVDVLRGNHDRDRWRVEFLITFGGPTVRVVVDNRWPVAEFQHSWGMDNAGNNRIEWDMTESDSAVWVALAEEVVESGI